MLVVELFAAILILGIPAAIILILVLYRDRPLQSIPKNYDASKTVYPSQVQFNTAYIRWWIELQDQENGQRISKVFSEQLVIGRYLPIKEETGRLYLRDLQTISRNQCAIISYNGFLWIENLSKVNTTEHNGRPIEEPQLLRQGDYLNMGGHYYRVVGISQCA